MRQSCGLLSLLFAKLADGPRSDKRACLFQATQSGVWGSSTADRERQIGFSLAILNWRERRFSGLTEVRHSNCIFSHLFDLPKCVIQPVIDSAKSESLSTHLAMGSGTLSGSEAHECFGTSEVFVEFFGLPLKEHVFFCVQD